MQSAPQPVYSTATRAAALPMGDWLNESFDLFKREWVVWVLQTLLVFVVGMGLSVVLIVPPVGFFWSQLAASGAFNTGSGSPPDGLIVGLLAYAYVGFPFTILLVSCVAQLLSCGMYRTAAKQLAGESISVRDLILPPYFVLPTMGIIAGLAIVSQIAAFVTGVGGLAISGLYYARWPFAIPLIIEKRLGMMDALRESWDATQTHCWYILLYFVVLSLIATAGFLVCMVGALVTTPVTVLGTMIAYREVIERKSLPTIAATAPASMTAGPPSPSATGVYGAAGPPISHGACPTCRRPVALGAVRCPACSTPFPQGFGKS